MRLAWLRAMRSRMHAAAQTVRLLRQFPCYHTPSTFPRERFSSEERTGVQKVSAGTRAASEESAFAVPLSGRCAIIIRIILTG